MTQQHNDKNVKQAQNNVHSNDKQAKSQQNIGNKMQADKQQKPGFSVKHAENITPTTRHNENQLKSAQSQNAFSIAQRAHEKNNVEDNQKDAQKLAKKVVGLKQTSKQDNHQVRK